MITNNDVNVAINSIFPKALYDFDEAEEWIELEMDGYKSSSSEKDNLVLIYHYGEDKNYYLPNNPTVVYLLDNFRWEPIPGGHSMKAVGYDFIKSSWCCTWRKVNTVEELNKGLKELKIKLKKFQIEQDFKH